MSEPRRSTRARAREEAAPAAPETPSEKPARGAKASLKRKRTSVAAAKESTPSTPVTDGAPLPPKQTLPLRIVEGAPLPTLPEPQPLDLPSSEWQTIQQSGVLETSFERSKAVWLSGTNFRTFHAHFNQPKKLADRTDEDKAKAQRQKELLKNFPHVGADRVVVKLVIEPHTLPIKLYGPREVGKPAHKKTATPSPYAPWPNHNHSQPNQHTKYHNGPPIQQKPQPRPPQPPKPVQAAPPPQAPAAPAPDPVIHMLAARAGTDPELKAVMKIVAAGSASKEQLEFFQTHINELTAILARQKEEKTPKAAPPPPAPKPPPPPPPAPKQIAPPPLPRPVQPMQQPIQPSAPRPYTPTAPHGQIQQAPPHHPHPPYANSYSKPPPYHPPPQVPVYNPPPRTTYRPLVFSFVHGNEDKFYFPSYSFMEWLPNGTGAKLSFLITKMKPKPEPAAQPPSTPAPKSTPALTPTPAPAPNATPDPAPSSAVTPAPNPTNPTFAPIQPAASTPSTPFHPPKPPQRIEDFDEMNDIDNIEFYQPVTVLLLIENDDGDEIASALPRSIRPPHIVEKYMNEVFDRCKRADETYLAFRLPRDAEDVPEKRTRSGDVTPAVATPTQDVVMGGMSTAAMSAAEKKKSGRPRKSLA
ncbi:Helicase SRCAP [Stemphylium lycopersici]|nr:Helicase SRCAP [Stemphylium lycopersici]